MGFRYFLGFIFVALGLSGLLGYDLGRFIGPAVLIFIGWAILTGRHQRKWGRGDNDNRQILSQDAVNETFVFTGAEKFLRSENFSDSKITAVFSGADFDLSNVKTKQKVIAMELVAVFGGLRLRIPQDWSVVSDVVGILGGVDNRTSPGRKTVELRINGSAVLGGIEISN